ncbi:TQO small subunit DoxD [Bradyrhizobium valentinum]|uniref:TQO small subunit DoxD n=1 Tax=Bradyrhizobium valentinum TaxID=1518501 RepID=UPI0018D2337C|nr:TQO small subunit DoxD [Bradyrhizobium valentinum]
MTSLLRRIGFASVAVVQVKDGTAAASHPAAALRGRTDALRSAALALLSIRFIQGFIYWGGGSRRFIYAPAKLDPNAASWMANKLQSAMPGAPCSERISSLPFCYIISIFCIPHSSCSAQPS